jgi:hypothetical protein
MLVFRKFTVIKSRYYDQIKKASALFIITSASSYEERTWGDGNHANDLEKIVKKLKTSAVS